MLETILEKVLVNNLGPYVTGIDKKNLNIGIFSGNVVIGGISIKPEAIEMLGLPITLKFSFVGRYAVVKGLKAIASRPVEVVLEDVFIVVQPTNMEEWSHDEDALFANRMHLVERLVQGYALKLLEKASSKDGKKEEESGMVGKLVEKIIDNLQISIKNIHVRFENPFAREKYAWGITLGEMVVCTTNAKGEKEFVDRTLPENKMLPLYKLLSLKDLGVYWLSNHEKLYGDFSHEEALKHMREFLKEIVMPAKGTVAAVKKDYIISLSATCRVIQKNKKSAWVMEKPDFDVKLDLKPIDLHLKKPQLQDLIKLLEFFNKYERFKNQKHIEKQRAIGPHNMEEIEKDIEEFNKIFTKVYKHPQRDELRGNEKLTVTIGDHKEVERFKDLLVLLPEENILKTVKKVVKEIEREKQLKAYDEKKQEKKGFLGGWISWGGDQEEKDPKKREEKAKEAARLREEEEAKIERYLQGLFGEGEEGTEGVVKEGEHRNLLALDFMLEGANIHLSHTSAAGNEEGVNFFIKGLKVDVGMTTKGKKVGLTVKDMGFGLRTKAAGSVTYIDTAVVRRVNYWLPLEEAKNIIALDFEENPKGKFEGMYVKLDLQRVEVIFRSAVTERMLNFFNVKIKDEALKNQAVDQLEKVQKKAEEAANSVVQDSIKKKITVNIDAPVIVIPFLQNGDPNSECWVLNLGNLGVNTKEPECTEDHYYETFLLNLQRIKFQYFPTQTLYKKVQRSLVEKGDLENLRGEDKENYEKKVFDLVEEFSIDVELDQILNEYKGRQETKEKPLMNVEVMIPDINFKLRPDIYSHLLKTKEVFAALEEAHLEFVEASYKKMLEGCTKAGSLYVFEKYFGNMAWVNLLRTEY